MVITGGLLYGAYQMFIAFPALNIWYGETFGWSGVFAIILLCLVAGRTVSLHLTTKVILPWLES
jgi:hypothetical protein